MTIYAYALQDSIGRFLTLYNRAYVMDVGHPKLYKTAGHAAKAREKLQKFYGLKITRIKLEVQDDNVYGAARSGNETSKRSRRNGSNRSRQTGVESPQQGLPIGNVQD